MSNDSAITNLYSQMLSNADLDAIADKVEGGRGSWISAIAKAMGKAMGIQAGRVVELSNAIAKNAGDQKAYGDSHLDDKGMKQSDPGLAAEGMALNAQFQAASQEFSLTTNAFSTAIKALGEGSTTLARKGG